MLIQSRKLNIQNIHHRGNIVAILIRIINDF